MRLVLRNYEQLSYRFKKDNYSRTSNRYQYNPEGTLENVYSKLYRNSILKNCITDPGTTTRKRGTTTTTKKDSVKQ